MEIHGLSMLNCLITIGDEDPNDTLHETDHDQILFERRVRNQRGQTCG